MPLDRPLLDLDYGSSNFTSCMTGSLVTVTQVHRQFHPRTSTYELVVDGQVPGISFPSVASTGFETSIVEIGFWPAVHEEWFVCTGNELGCVRHGPIRFEKNFLVPQITFPLADIACRYQIVMETTPIVCLSVAPIGYQNHQWKKAFTVVPLAILLLASLVSLLRLIRTQNWALFLSEFAMDAHTTRFFKSSPVADIVVYAQFVVQTGALHLRYPRFYPLFTANFGWSWLLVPSSWLSRVVEHYDPSRGDGGPSLVQLQDLGSALHIRTQDFFVHAVLVFGLMMAALAALCLIAWMAVETLAALNAYRFGGQRSRLASACIGFSVRLVTLFYVPLTALAFYQLMLPSSWLLVVISVFLLVVALFGFYCHIAQIVCGRPQVFVDIHMLLRYGSLFNALRPDTSYYVVIFLVYRLLLSAMIGLFQMSGEVQVACILFLEATLLCLHLIRPPFRDRVMNLVAITVVTFRTASSALNFCYLPMAHLRDRERQYVAYTQICMHFIVFMLFLGIHLARLILSLDRLPSDSPLPSRASSPLSLPTAISRPVIPQFLSTCVPRFRFGRSPPNPGGRPGQRNT